MIEQADSDDLIRIVLADANVHLKVVGGIAEIAEVNQWLRNTPS